MAEEQVLIAGDTHMRTEQVEYLIRMAGKQGCSRILQVGDFGYYPRQHYGQRYLRKLSRMLGRAGLDLYFVDGNHEDHDALLPYRAADDFVTVSPRVHYVPRGLRWTWGKTRFLGLGGAYSTDRAWRQGLEAKQGRKRYHWWPEEILTDADVVRCGEGPVDVLVAHDAPISTNLGAGTGRDFSYRADIDTQMNRQRVQEVVSRTRPTFVYHGHYHVRYRDGAQHRGGWAHVIGLDCHGSGEASWAVAPV